MNRGVVICAHNNSDVNYLKIAAANAKQVSLHLGVPVCLISDSTSVDANLDLISFFDSIILVDKIVFNNIKHFNLGNENKLLPFYNCNHGDVYDLSPFEETLFIDADYFIMTDALSKCWGSDKKVMINYNITCPNSADYYDHLNDIGPKQYWATVIYFRKSDYAKHMFNMVKHVQNNYNYYMSLYFMDSNMFRNDNAFTIAINTLGEDIFDFSELPVSPLVMCWGNTTRVLNISKDTICVWTDRFIVNYKSDIHIMNKSDALDIANFLLEK